MRPDLLAAAVAVRAERDGELLADPADRVRPPPDEAATAERAGARRQLVDQWCAE